jgi:hypothetical protein
VEKYFVLKTTLRFNRAILQISSRGKWKSWKNRSDLQDVRKKVREYRKLKTAQKKHLYKINLQMEKGCKKNASAS